MRHGHDSEVVVQAILHSPKYRALDAGMVRWVVARELAKGRPIAEAEKAARAKLHQVVMAYLPERPAVERWLAELEQAPDATALRAVCRHVLTSHASARERLAQLEHFYAPIFAPILSGPHGAQPPLRVLDLACGLNPMALPWMGLPSGSHLMACDVQSDLTGFLARALPLLTPHTGVTSEAFAWNLLEGAPPRRADVALVLKTLPCLEQLDAELPRRLLLSIDAPLLVVSFPVRSLGGRAKGMATSYATRFEALLAELALSAERLPAQDELIYLVRKPAPASA